MIKTTYSILKAADKIDLHVRDFYPNGIPCNRILFMHGLGEHSGRYQHVAEFFCARGFAVRSYDHRGHGRSGGARGDVPYETALIDDAAIVLRDWNSKSDSPETAPFLLGHSMGGLFAARFALTGIAPLSGLILSSPALALPLSSPQKLLLKILTALAPGIAVSNGLKRRYLSHDSQVIEAYTNDPLVHSKITARLLNAMLAAIFITQRDAAQLSMPTLLVFAGDDHLVDPEGSEQLVKKLLPGIGTRYRYDTLYHEIFNENKIAATAVFNDVSRWLNEEFSIDI